MAFKQIANSAPTLGGVASSIIQSAIIAPASANKPYILGAGVIGTAPTGSRKGTKAFIGAGATIKGIMCLGANQIQQRGINGVISSGYTEGYNQVGIVGAFWAALDLANFNKTTVDAQTAGETLSVDSNGVFAYGATAPAGFTAVTSDITVLNYFDKAIVPTINESFTVGANTTTFNYAKGIGAILLVIR